MDDTTKALEQELSRLKYRKMLARGKGENAAINRSIKKAQEALDAAKQED